MKGETGITYDRIEKVLKQVIGVHGQGHHDSAGARL